MDHSENPHHCRNTLLSVSLDDSRKARDSAIISYRMNMEATHRHYAFSSTKETDDVKGEITEA